MIEFVVISIVAVFAVLFYIGVRYERKQGAKSGGFALLACVSLMVGGCATPYQPYSTQGGYSHTPLGVNVADVYFQGNGFTDKGVVKRYALRYAAELTLNSGYDYFLLEREGGESQTETTRMPATVTTDCYQIGFTTDCYSNVSGGQNLTFNKHTSALRIRMFQGQTPNQTGYYDAAFIVRQYAK